MIYKSRRSREGAWIEMQVLSLNSPRYISRSREGAWIEILCLYISYQTGLLSLP